VMTRCCLQGGGWRLISGANGDDDGDAAVDEY